MRLRSVCACSLVPKPGMAKDMQSIWGHREGCQKASGLRFARYRRGIDEYSGFLLSEATVMWWLRSDVALV
ncbi:Bifunctional Udp-N-Acetylglucosamine Transferase And Deubiquitinase Alg13-Like [Manis pentadactyla]|nr:Bifunctional Udp-N-Acetylglucosamine Transferase And Deubiquitinase Alg13-Like [Manis pentadactyla]